MASAGTVRIKLTRAGYLACQLLDRKSFSGDELENRISWISRNGPEDEFERQAVAVANAADFPEPQFPMPPVSTEPA